MREKLWGKINDLEKLKAHVPGVIKRNVFGPDTGWDDFVLRHFTLPAGASTAPDHTHDWEHWVMTLEGEGEAHVNGEVCDLPKGSWIFVPSGVPHSFYNIGAGDFVFTCIVRTHGDPDASK